MVKLPCSSLEFSFALSNWFEPVVFAFCMGICLVHLSQLQTVIWIFVSGLAWVTGAIFQLVWLLRIQSSLLCQAKMNLPKGNYSI